MSNFRSKRIEKAHNVNFIFIRKFWKLFIFFFFIFFYYFSLKRYNYSNQISILIFTFLSLFYLFRTHFLKSKSIYLDSNFYKWYKNGFIEIVFPEF